MNCEMSSSSEVVPSQNSWTEIRPTHIHKQNNAKSLGNTR